MTVRKSAAITFTPGEDFFRTDRGIKWGVKVTDTGEFKMVTIFVQDGAGWTTGASLSSMDWESDMRAHGGSIKAWFIDRCLPAINAWLADKFKGGNAPQELGTLSEQLDRLIVSELRVTMQPDGSLVATMG